ncbi:unnamed protein product [Toxocara canis]|uniref:Uncharacterized protein n=1 Tax=Toxocara canis TaxID=6265 RepID=A0A3P7EZE7_TOXCA|nr:unnamed protein product [Toxocara canis]
MLNVWSELPCINWCYYAQLACPHLASSKVADYAGHPSFQCRGKSSYTANSAKFEFASCRHFFEAEEISAVASCNCIHPCDLRAPTDSPDGSETSVVASQIIRFVGEYAPPNRPEGVRFVFNGLVLRLLPSYLRLLFVAEPLFVEASIL